MHRIRRRLDEREPAPLPRGVGHSSGPPDAHAKGECSDCGAEGGEDGGGHRMWAVGAETDSGARTGAPSSGTVSQLVSELSSPRVGGVAGLCEVVSAGATASEPPR